MKTKVAAIYGKQDVRLREFELPPISDDELLVSVISDSVCLSTYKAALLGSEHKRVPDDVAQHAGFHGAVAREQADDRARPWCRGRRWIGHRAVLRFSGHGR